MKSFFTLNVLLVSIVLVSCTSIANFNFRILEEGTPAGYDSGCNCYVGASPGYDQDFDFTIYNIQIVANAVLTYWEHMLVIDFEVKNNKNERSLLPGVGIVLLNENETQVEPNYFEYPYFTGTFNPILLYFQNNNDAFSLPIGSLGSKEKLKFRSTTTLYQNSNDKLEGLYYLHFLRIPAKSADHKDSFGNEIQFIKENSMFNISLNMNSIYSF